LAVGAIRQGHWTVSSETVLTFTRQFQPPLSEGAVTRRRSSRDREDAVHAAAEKPSSVFADLWAAACAARAHREPAPGLHPPAGSGGHERHGQAFRAFLAATFEEKTRSVQAWLESAGDAARILSRWRRLEAFGDLIPDCARDEEIRLFVIELHTIASGLLPRPAAGAGPLSLLSEREWEVLAAMGQGLATKEIAHRLGIETETVYQHRKHIVRKTGLSGAALVAYAARLFAPPPVASRHAGGFRRAVTRN
jgi:DNA-binding CsgD family transcriptional regulator